jgi:leader peptidase (prepilin peptidase)/N-methyltransferase
MSVAAVLELYADHPGAYALAFVLGTLWGSFANVCIVRLPPTDEHPQGRSVVHPPSHCTVCNARIRWYDNFPILSYLLLRGRCRFCRTQFSPRYLLVELATGLLFVAFYHFAVNDAYAADAIQLRLLRFAILAAFAFTMVVIAFIDLDTGLVLDKVTYPVIPAFYLCSLLLPEAPWWRGLVGAAVGYGLIRGISDGYYLLFRRRGLGYGDGKLLAVIGALLGWQAVVAALFAGSLFGTIIGIPLILFRGRPQVVNEDNDSSSLRHVAIPFGPYLAMGGVAYVFLSPWLSVSFAALWG